MILQHHPPLHLTYCLNIHRGESWAENFDAIREKALAVKNAIAPNQWFGLGLRLSQAAAQTLLGSEALIDEARAFFSEHQLYPFTINGFPYGNFHGTTVKESVYAPDWRTDERREYTLQLADVFTHFLPPEVDGSISTVPCSFKPWITTDEEKAAMARNLGTVAAYLSALREDTGQEIHLGLEPEPDCFLETTGEMISFFKDSCLRDGAREVQRILQCNETHAEDVVRRHLGVCLDTCHAALQYEDVLDSYRRYQAEGVRISKVQLSAALRGPADQATREALKSFAEPVYLHQVKGRTTANKRVAWYDLPEALGEMAEFPELEEVRVHFHVPLFLPAAGALGSTATELTPEFFRALRAGGCSHLEIETYTFDVLPPELNPGDVVRSIAREYEWVLSKLD